MSSYFEDCPRDEAGHCKPSGGGDGSTSKPPLRGKTPEQKIDSAIARHSTGEAGKRVAEIAKKVTKTYGPKARTRLTRNLNELRFHDDQGTLHEEWHGSSELPGQELGGFWDYEAGGVHLGPSGGGGRSREGVVAHEFAHAIDNYGRKGSLSSTRGWRDAFKEEIAKPDSALGPYARTNEGEGFAEFGRYLAGWPKLAKERLPKCYAFWKANGLV